MGNALHNLNLLHPFVKVLVLVARLILNYNFKVHCRNRALVDGAKGAPACLKYEHIGMDGIGSFVLANGRVVAFNIVWSIDSQWPRSSEGRKLEKLRLCNRVSNLNLCVNLGIGNKRVEMG